MKKIVLGIVGCGNIGLVLAKVASAKMKDKVSAVAVWDIDKTRIDRVKKELPEVLTASGEEDLIEKSDLVLEAVSPAAAIGLILKAINKKKDILVMSVGGIIGNEDILDKARKEGIRILFPSGAIAGIDGLKAAKLAGLDSVKLTTRKSPASLKGAPYLNEKGIDTDKIKKETVVFEGNAFDAIKAFPKNVNVSALLSIAGIGAKKTKVRVVADPACDKNIHEIEIKGKAGTIFTRVENVPSEDNPKTSFLAALSATAALAEYFDSVRIGT